MSAISPNQDQKDRFVRVLRDTGSRTVAAQAVGFSRTTMQRHMELDDAFAEAVADAELDAADALEQEARRRAVEGVDRERWLGGKDGYAITETHYSDTLLLKLLEANNPAKFTNRSKTEISNPDGSLVPQLGDTELAARLTSLLAAAEARMKKEQSNG